VKKNRSVLFYCCLALLFSFVSVFQTPLIHAQTRVSDKDVEALMKNLKEDSKSFRSNFETALKKSAIRRTSQEKDAKEIVSSFEKQMDSMLSEFKKTKRGDVDVETAIGSAQEIDRLLHNLQLDPKTVSEWQKIRSELDRVSNAFGINAHYSRS